MTEQFANNATSPLASSIGSSDTSLTVTTGTPFSSSGNFRIVVDSEIMLVTARNSNTLSITRGQEGTVAAAHNSGANVTQIVTAGAIAQLKVDTRTSRVITTTKTSQYFIQNSDEVIACNTSGGSFTVFLPNNPTSGEIHFILDVGGVFSGKPLTISGNGNNLVAAAGILTTADTISTNFLSTVYLWNGTFWSLL